MNKVHDPNTIRGTGLADLECKVFDEIRQRGRNFWPVLVVHLAPQSFPVDVLTELEYECL